jgi:ABC-type antimicrobial peptide transport system permease subunit
MLQFSLYAGFFVAGVGLLFALYGVYTTLWTWPNSWAWLLYLLGGFVVGFLGTFCALLDFRGLGKKDVM